MREIDKLGIGKKLIELIDEEHPIDEDIGILDQNGEMLAAVISKDAYQFFLKKVEEAEDEMDQETVDQFDNSGEKENG
ncbi:MAG: hypothetical protein ACRBCS_12640 [Cellvibrionaceae bacterium]